MGVEDIYTLCFGMRWEVVGLERVGVIENEELVDENGPVRGDFFFLTLSFSLCHRYSSRYIGQL